MDDEYTKAVKYWETPNNVKVKDVERFRGFAKYHRGFMAGFAKKAQPLYNLTVKMPGPEQYTAFEALQGDPTAPRY